MSNFIDEEYIVSLKDNLFGSGYNKYDVEIIEKALRLYNDSHNKKIEIMCKANTKEEPRDEHYLEYGKFIWRKQTERYLEEIEKICE